jgi:uncharacterized protein (UPF0276 family)
MKLAVNYSVALADLLREGAVDIDLFKCPVWPETIAEAQALRPAYAHLPLVIYGDGKVMNSETKAEVDWEALDAIISNTETRHINLHPSAPPNRFPHIPLESTAPEHLEQFTQAMIDCVNVAIARYGVEKVQIENVYGLSGNVLRVLLLPEMITTVVEETGCGFLFDMSHAQLAARQLGMDAREYIAGLPLDRIQEVHVTGIHLIDEAKQAAMRALGLPDAFIDRWAGQWLDHQYFTDDDWDFLDWAFDQLHSGAWAQPWVVSMEYGGVGPIWEDVAERDVLRVQIPRLYKLVHGQTVGETVSD